MELIRRLFSLQTAVHFFFFYSLFIFVMGAEVERVDQKQSRGILIIYSGEDSNSSGSGKRRTFKILAKLNCKIRFEAFPNSILEITNSH